MDYIIGADEVGRGCLAGPLYVCAVLVSSTVFPIEDVTDSKQLSSARRRTLHSRLTQDSNLTFEIAFRSADFIDQRGIQKALHECFRDAVNTCLSQVPEGKTVEVRIDGKRMDLDFGSVPTIFIVKGDALDWVIGAASIIAKVERDSYMIQMAKQYPDYMWEDNKGYGTVLHRQAIYERGLTPLHRATFCRRHVKKPGDEIDVLSLFE